MENQISKPPYINRPPIKPPKNSMPELKEEFIKYSEGISEMGVEERYLAEIAIENILLETVNHPDWVSDEALGA